MPSFEGKVVFTMTVTAKVFVDNYAPNEDSDEFDEDELAELLLERATQIASGVSELVEEDETKLINSMDGVLLIKIDDNEDGETQSWEQIEE